MGEVLSSENVLWECTECHRLFSKEPRLDARDTWVAYRCPLWLANGLPCWAILWSYSR